MLRFSAIGLETTHGFIYPALLNGYDPDRLRAHSPEIVWSIFPTGGTKSVEGGRVVACFDPDIGLARRVAEACRIDRVCETLDDAFSDVDGVLILAGDGGSHRALATPAVEVGLPTFVDKPFTANTADALALAELADRRGAPLFCTSALRFAQQTEQLRMRLPRTVGEPLAAHSIGTGDYASYAVHSLEFLLSVFGCGVTRTRSLGQAGFDTAELVYADGRRAIWQVCQRMAWQFHLAIYGTEGMDQTSITFADRYTIFRQTAAEMVRFARTRSSPVPIADTLEIVRLLETIRSTRLDVPVEAQQHNAPAAVRKVSER